MRFLPKAKREAMYTLYAFCRHIDDIVDGDSSIAEKQELLQAWREELDNIYDKKVPATEIGRRIYKNCMRFKLPKSEFLRLIDSISMDVPNPVQAPRLSDFYRYCRGVAGVPGSLSLRIFGCSDENDRRAFLFAGQRAADYQYFARRQRRCSQQSSVHSARCLQKPKLPLPTRGPSLPTRIWPSPAKSWLKLPMKTSKILRTNQISRQENRASG